MKNMYDDLDRLDEEGKKWGCMDMDKKPCFAEHDFKTCLALIEKNCYKCKFYKTVDQLDGENLRLLEIEREKINEW